MLVQPEMQEAFAAEKVAVSLVGQAWVRVRRHYRP
jgi:hypothetical protein